MIKSMTGFGRASGTFNGRDMTIELKSVNHKYLDLSFRMPQSLGFLEEFFRLAISERISRGHLDITVTYANNREDAKRVDVNVSQLRQYTESGREISKLLNVPFDLTVSSLMRMPNAFTIADANEDTEEILSLAKSVAQEALTELYDMRCREGSRIYSDFTEKIAAISDIKAQMTERAPAIVSQYSDRLAERIATLVAKPDMDPARLATEVAIFAEKACIDEELFRLGSHAEELRSLLDLDSPAGRRMDFVIQEVNRELNTIASKANDEVLAKLAIIGKSELEKLREQVQNIE